MVKAKLKIICLKIQNHQENDLKNRIFSYELLSICFILKYSNFSENRWFFFVRYNLFFVNSAYLSSQGNKVNFVIK